MTLSEFSSQIRIIGKLTALMAVVLVVFYLMIMLLINSLKKPEIATEYINPVYGKIKTPVFEEEVVTDRLQFVLDTIDGKYPETTGSASVYFIPEPKSTLAYLTKVDTMAVSFGFDTSVYKPQTLNEQWVKYEDTSKILEVNIRSYSFKFRYKPVSDLQSLVEATPEAKFTLLENSYIEKARSELTSRDAYPPHLAAGFANPVYQRYDLSAREFIPVQTGEYPQAIRIDFFRRKEGLDIEPPKHFVSQNYIVLAPLDRNPEVVEAQYMSYAKLDTDPGTYPLLTSEEAFQKLKNGEARTVSLSENHTGKIRIKEIYIAYYDPQNYQPYFQPVFVFLGDQNYVGYLPAIEDEYLLR